MTDQPDHHLSKDGSSTLYSNTFGQFYHNPNGAIAESRHVFFQSPGIDRHLRQNRSLNILEVGFGTGLNFLLSLDYYLKHEASEPLHFYSVEAYPITAETARRLNYAELINRPELSGLLPDIFKDLKKGLNTFEPIQGKDVSLHLFVGRFEEVNFPPFHADFIFHDPFSPEVNEELWTEEVFQKLLSYAGTEGILATYCAASKARGAMAAAGWKAARAPGALGKREMTLASPEAEKLKGFKRLNESRLAERYRKGDFS